MPKVATFSACSDRERSAFTLLELLIVILLLSMMATLIVGVFSRDKGEKNSQGILQIREWIHPLPAEGAQLVCIDACSRCFLQTGGGKMEKTSFSLPPLQAYTVGEYSQAERLDFGRYRDQPVCLRFRYRPNGSTSRMILESEGRFYYVPAYFGRVESFSSLAEAVSRWQDGARILRSRWGFY